MKWLVVLLVLAGCSAAPLNYYTLAFVAGTPQRSLPLVIELRRVGVAAYLEAQPEVGEMLDQIDAFLARWLPAFEHDQRSYLTVAIGCTGGQHRSVYMAEVLARRFAGRSVTLIRHRELDARD